MLSTIVSLIVISYVAIVIGYVLGMLFAITPYINEWLLIGGLTTADLPTVFVYLTLIFGWLLFLGSLFKPEGGASK